ncbi:MAG: DUF3592 domain-containing protein, partial [Proteobacteria bacterium]|nr:DUF3592 domain-containing protein [Pseudomonadota bacterium]
VFSMLAPFMLGYGVYMFAKTYSLKKRAVATAGRVIDLTAYNDSCSEDITETTTKKLTRDCTKYYGTIVYYDEIGLENRVVVEVAQARGHDQPLEASRVVTGDTIQFLVDPENPEQAFSEEIVSRNIVMSIVLMLLGGVFSLYGFFNYYRKPRKV